MGEVGVECLVNTSWVDRYIREGRLVSRKSQHKPFHTIQHQIIFLHQYGRVHHALDSSFLVCRRRWCHRSSPQCPALPVAQRRLASLDGDTAPQHRAQGSRSAPLVQTVLHRHAAQVRRHPPPDGVGVGLVVFLGADHLDFALHVALDLSFGVHFDGPVGLDFGDVFDFGLGVHVHVDHDGVRCDASRSRDHQSIRMAHKRMAEL